MVLKMLFLSLSNADIFFSELELACKFYTAAKILSIIKYIEFIDKKNFLLKSCWIKTLKPL